MRDLHWKDHVNDADHWTHLEIEMASQELPGLRLYAGTGRRFKLLLGEVPAFWGRVEHEWYGAWFLRNENHWDEAQMIIPPIRSADIIAGDPSLAGWSRFFLKALQQSSNSPLYQGSWHLSNANHRYALTPKRAATQWNVFGREQAFKKRPFYVDWGIMGSGALLALKEEPPVHSGRVKWYLKLIDQGQCPPILVWFVKSLDAYVILDGHCRLKACYEKKVIPEILVLGAVQKTFASPNPSMQQSVIRALGERKKNWKKNAIPLEKENALLIEVFDDRPFITAVSRSKAQRDLADSWNTEVRAFEYQEGIDHDELKRMLGEPEEGHRN